MNKLKKYGIMLIILMIVSVLFLFGRAVVKKSQQESQQVRQQVSQQVSQQESLQKSQPEELSNQKDKILKIEKPDYDVKVELSKDLEFNKNKFKVQVVVDAKWGEKEEDLGLLVNEETVEHDESYTTPGCYAVDDIGNIYIYDTLNGKIKVFKDKQYIKSINMPATIMLAYPDGRKRPVPTFLRDMAVDSKGTIYGLLTLFDEVLLIKENGEVSSYDEGIDFFHLDRIDVLSSGNIMIQDQDRSAQIRVRKFGKEKELLSENKSELCIDFDLYEYEDNEGNSIKAERIGDKTHKYDIVDNKGNNTKNSVAFSALSDDPEIQRRFTILGTDKNGKIYYWINETKKDSWPIVGEDGYIINEKEYITVVDPINNLTITERAKNTNVSMTNSTACMNNRFKKMDINGNVYQLLLDKNGYRIVKYSFE